MTKKNIYKKIAFIILMISFMVYAPASAQDSGLVDLLAGRLGITKTQASGGAGTIFQVAKQNLNDQEFSSVANAVPGIDRMMDSAPKAETGSSTLGGLSSLLGGSSKKISGMTGLAGSFEKLGLNAGMVNQFLPIILDYVQGSGGESVMNLLKGALL